MKATELIKLLEGTIKLEGHDFDVVYTEDEGDIEGKPIETFATNGVKIFLSE